MDPNKLNLDPDTGFLLNLDPDPVPDPGIYYNFFKKKTFKIPVKRKTMFLKKDTYFLITKRTKWHLKIFFLS